MKIILSALVLSASLSAQALEVRNDISYTELGQYSRTGFSGTSRFHAAREQTLANAEQIAVFNQAYTAQINEMVKAKRSAAIESLGAEKVANMTDQEIISFFEQQ